MGFFRNKAKKVNLCQDCKEREGSAYVAGNFICNGCFAKRYGVIQFSSTGAEYFGGHKAFLAGGYISDSQIGEIYLTNSHLLFLKDDEDPAKQWTISIPLKSIIVERWGIEENIRRKQISGLGSEIGDTGILLGSGIIQESGKSHRIIVPYIDENGIPQEPRFGISSFGGKKIRELAAKLYQQVVKVKNQDTPSSKKETIKETTDDPLAVLKIRLAKGEITKEEYEELKSVLEK
jgi:hypothetical protein